MISFLLDIEKPIFDDEGNKTNRSKFSKKDTSLRQKLTKPFQSRRDRNWSDSEAGLLDHMDGL